MKLRARRMDAQAVKSVVGLLLVAALLGAGGCVEAEENASSSGIRLLKVQVREVTEIGQSDDTDAGASLLAAPVAVCSDGAGNVYVADVGAMGIKKYDANGKYLATIGRRGDGPGEFRNLSDVMINREGDLVVVGGRRVTFFSPEGDLKRTHSLPIIPSSIRQLGNGYLFLEYQIGRENLLHVYPTDLDTIAFSFGTVTDFIDTENPVENVTMRSQPGSVTVRDNVILYTPFLYNGRINRYENEREDVWRRGNFLNGYAGESTYSTVESGSTSADRVEARMWVQGERYGALYHNTSWGLFSLNSGEIVHFTWVESGSERIFGMEVYGPDGELVGYGPIDSTSLNSYGAPTEYAPIVSWKDQQDRFYLIERAPNILPKVRVMELKYEREET